MPWYFFQGYRWLPGVRVDKILRYFPNQILAVTDNGIGYIYRAKMTLEQKAVEVQKVYDSGRHGRKDRGPNHPMIGLVRIGVKNTVYTGKFCRDIFLYKILY